VPNLTSVGIQLITKYFPNLSDTQIRSFTELETQFRYWNEQINLISRKDIDLLYERHVLHSLAIAKVISFKSGTSILDVGTGGGFPGIPLAILFPECDFHLVDSIGKKIMVVKEICNALDLKNVKAEQIRAEQIKGNYDFVVSRAVTQLKPFLQWVSKKFKPESNNSLPNGVIALKGGDLKEELSEIKRAKKEYAICDYFDEEFFETKKVIYISMVK